MAAKLPGISFQTVPPVPLEILPRMDIAAFVGFASSGPINIPVPVEDVGRFRDIFGADLPLALDGSTGKMQYAFLSQAVESFFMNGGRRCWIVRVAGDGAKYNSFSIPGLAAVIDGKILQAQVRARAQGSWSDDIMAGAALSSKNIELNRYAYDFSTYEIETPSHVEEGDLLRIDTGNAFLLFAADSVEKIDDPSQKSSKYSGNPLYNVTGSRGFWFFSGFPSIQSYQCADVFYLSAEGENRFPYSRIIAPDDDIPYFRIELKINQSELPHPGSLLRIKIDEKKSVFLTVSGIESANEKYLFSWKKITVNDIEGLVEFLGQIFGITWVKTAKIKKKNKKTIIISNESNSLSLTLNDDKTAAILKTDDGRTDMFIVKNENGELNIYNETIVVKGKYPQYMDGSESQSIKGWKKGELPAFSASILTFELFALHDKDKLAQIKDLSFVPEHPRFFGNLPIDEKLFSKKVSSSLDEEASLPRFPFAAAEGMMTNPILYLPIGMPSFFDPEITKRANETFDGQTALHRDGLCASETEPTYLSHFFLDNALNDTGSASLLNEANFLYYQEKPEKIAPLTGIHSLLPMEEVTMVAVPDAILTGWKKNGPESRTLQLTPPHMGKPHISDDKDTYFINWNKITDAESYLLQESTDASFKNIKLEHRYPERTGQEKIHFISSIGCPQTVFIRMRAECKDSISGWSNTVHLQKPLPDFSDCVVGIIEAPELSDPVWVDGWLIKWKPQQTNPDLYYTLQESIDPEFLTAVTIYSGKETSFLLRRNDTKIYYFRVKTQNASNESPWSNTVQTEVSPSSSWVMLDPNPDSSNQLIDIQRGLLRFCLSRGDMFAILTLPVHYLEADALSHKAALEDCPGEENITSFGALYHPWLNQGTNRGNIMKLYDLLPPDGAVCGKIASISTSGGAWLSPANVAVEGAVSLMPIIDNAGWERLYCAGINLIRHEPRGFLIMSASTLSKDPMFLNINVRRLIILLRRLSVREGSLYTFQPNNEDFRRIIRNRFEILLGDMYRRGAFAGSTPEESFRVVADRSINTIQSIEQGRFIIELHFAPSLPMTFITVRLVQTGNYGFMITEV